MKLVAVAQSGAYSTYVSICGASQMPKEPVMLIFAKFVWREEFQGLRSVRNRSILDVCEDFEHERNVAFKRGQKVLAHFAERSNEKELNEEITPSDEFLIRSPYQ